MIDEFSELVGSGDFDGDNKPSILHVLHSWGGGIGFFAKDLQAGDVNRTHFFLKSHARDNLPPFGKELCLYSNLDGDPLATWHLSAPILDTDLHSIEVVRILDSIIEKWAVGAVVVSSLIGHALDVLKTGLPTALAVHDVYPFWPLLHDASNDDYSIEYLRRSLSESKTMNVFARHEAEHWLAIRDELISTIRQNNISCISPSAFAKERVCGIDPRLRDARWSIVPHGITETGKIYERVTNRKPGNLKVLVPGHINGGKGELLLKELVPNLPDGIELVLLGSAHLSNQFASANVKAIDYYEREDLGNLIDTIEPDIAMLASTVPETYGYVLSEMLQLGIPVICSNLGAYAERGKYLPGVTLVEANAVSFLEALLRFRDDHTLLSEQIRGLPYSFPDLNEVANIWAQELPAKAPQWLFEFTDDPDIEAEVKMNLQLKHHAGLLKAVYAVIEKNTQSGNDALNTINIQQSNIETLLESIDIQRRQLTTVLAKQNELEVVLSGKSEEIALLTNNAIELKNTIQGHAALIAEQQKDFKQEIEKLQSESESRISAMNAVLADMQSKRGWRIIKFFN